ncbi:MAG: alkaline phosphatase family protein [Leptospirales bacterium]
MKRISCKASLFNLIFLAGIELLWLGGMPWQVKPAQARTEPRIDHVFVFVFENEGFRDIVGNPSAPFINRIARHHGLLTDYHAMAHPSLPNYAALISGKTDGAHSDDPGQRFPDQTVVEEMVSRGLSVKGYFQGLPHTGFLGNDFPGKKPLYVVRHNPFFLFPRIRKNPEWRQRIVPIDELKQDLKSGRVPSFAFVVGDLCHDMHGGKACFDNGRDALVRNGDRFLRKWVERIRRSSAWRNERTAVIITWDEGRYPVWQRVANKIHLKHIRGWGGRVPFLVMTSFETGTRTIGGYEDHRRFVRTLGAIFGVTAPSLGPGKMLPPSLFTGSRPSSVSSR